MPAKPQSIARGVLLFVAILGFVVLCIIAGVRPAWAAQQAEPAPKQEILGAWQGTLKLGGIELRVVLKIARNEQGQYQATLDSPDQGAKGIPVAAFSREGNEITADIKRVAGFYTGTLADNGTEIKGKWKQAGQELALDLKRLDKEPDYRRPQDPKKPYPYREEEVTYANDAAKVTLAGTLTLPTSDRPVPAVLLISGSGPQDRDEALLGHRPFLVLADHLTRRGIAVLRVDDRGVGGSSGNTMTSTTDDVAGDVLAGVAYLKTRGEIDPKHIGLIGHSEGGLVAPLAASRSADVAFIVLMAGTGVTGDEIVYRQGELIAQAAGADAAAVAKSRDAQKRLFEIAKQESDPAKAEQRIREAISEVIAKEVGSPEARKGAEAQVAAQAKVILTPWFRYFLTYDPLPALRKVRCPVLAINGEKDLQVDPAQNLPPIETALKEAGNADFTVKVFPGLNHLFQHCQTGSPTEYGKIEETISPEVLELIAGWIAERSK